METNPVDVSKARKQISAALVKAQKAFGPALKTSTNPHFRSKYADLSACVEAVVEALNNHGIALTQRVRPAERGVVVETVLVHESGEELGGGELFVPANKEDAQGYGSALTYARRYSLTAFLGLAPEDDDGNAASAPKPARREIPTSTKPMPPQQPRAEDAKPARAKRPSPHAVDNDDRIPF